jgi:hypothetical protein
LKCVNEGWSRRFASTGLRVVRYLALDGAISLSNNKHAL